MKYTIDEIVEMIENAHILIPIEAMFHEDGSHITKKEYGKILIGELIRELKEKYGPFD